VVHDEGVHCGKSQNTERTIYRAMSGIQNEGIDSMLHREN